MNNDQVVAKISFDFTDLQLPVAYDAEGRALVPLKPICERFSLCWEGQWEKIKEPYLRARLGIDIKKLFMDQQRRAVVCIRVDRIAAFLSAVNVRNVRSAGNEIGADWLEQKQSLSDELICKAYRLEYEHQ